MLFALMCTDRPDSLEKRLAIRPQHLAYIQGCVSKIAFGGPLLDAQDRPCGSLLVIDVNDRAEAERFAADDPYARAGLFESTVIRPVRALFRDGKAVAG